MSQVDPRRLIDDAEVDADLRAMLRAGRADAVPPATADRLLARVEGATAAGATSTGHWLLAALIAAVAAGAAVYLLATRGEPGTGSPASPVPIVAAEPSIEPALPPATTGPTIRHDPPPPRSVPKSPAPPAGTASATPPGPKAVPAPLASSPPKPDAPPSELDLVRAARRALDGGDHGAAFDQAQDHERIYPQGLLAEEREAIAIEALTGLARGSDARERLDRFLNAYPQSSYRQRLRALVD